MADVVLKDRSGTPTTYENVEQIALNTPDGGETNFIDAAFITEQLASKIDASEIVKAGDSVLSTEADEKIPSMARMLEAVDKAKQTAKRDSAQYCRALSGYIPSETVTWNGDTTGKSHFLDCMYKVSDDTAAPEAFSIDLSVKKNGSNEYIGSYIAVNQNAGLSDKGIEVYIGNFGIVIVCSQGGSLTQTESESIAEDYDGDDLNYEIGTYLFAADILDGFIFISSATELSEHSGAAVETVEDFSGENIAPGKIPSTAAVSNFVQAMADNMMTSAPMFPPLLWDGDTTGRTNFLGIFYKVSDRMDLPEKFKVEVSEIKNVQTVYGTEEGITDYVENALKEAYGITIYGVTVGTQTSSYLQPLVVVTDRSGTLPAVVIEQMMGTNPGVDVPYEAGTYLRYESIQSGSVTFVSKAVSCMTVKDYIDSKFDELQEMITNEEV